MCEHTVERSRYAGEVERLDEESPVPDLPVRHEAPELLLVRAVTMRFLLLVGTERPELAVLGEDALDGVGAEGADELVLQVGVAHEEPETLHGFSRQVRAEPSTLESAAEGVLLARVAESGEPHVPSLGREAREEGAERLCAADRHDGDTLGVEVVSTQLGDRDEGCSIAQALHEHEGARFGEVGELLHEERVGASQ
jgi:hypothetical protein